MSKNIYYRYNPDTDNFERVYPSFKTRLISNLGRIGVSCGIALSFFFILYFLIETPTEENLKAENKKLKSEYGVLAKRLENSLKVMEHIKTRDDNFYRVMLQLDPVRASERYAGLDNESRYKELAKLSDAALVTRLNRRMDVLERQIYTQIQSYDNLKKTLEDQQDKLSHIPSVIPVSMADYTMSSGYGYRLDPIYGSSKFHEGLDFAASTGTEVFATADGKVDLARRQAAYGNCIEINHGYNYMSRYAHLSEILVNEGEEVKRGQLIGKVGSTGKSTGPHLHYEVRFKNEPQNPVNYYFMDLSPEEYAEMIQLAENAGHVMD